MVCRLYRINLDETWLDVAQIKDILLGTHVQQIEDEQAAFVEVFEVATFTTFALYHRLRQPLTNSISCTTRQRSAETLNSQSNIKTWFTAASSVPV